MPSLLGRSVLVTGGAGFIGSHLVDRLILEKTSRLIIVDNLFTGNISNLSTAKKQHAHLQFYRHDASDYRFMSNIISKNGVDVVFNLATKPLPHSFTDPEDTYMINVYLISTLLRLLREKKYKTLIHFSTSEVYGTAQTARMREDHPLKPQTPYAAGKAAADHMIMSYCTTFKTDIAIVRPFNTYGPRQNKGIYAGVIPNTIKLILAGEKPYIEGDGLQTRDFLFVGETVDAAINVYKTKKTRGSAINIGSGKEIRILDLIQLICKKLGYAGKVLQRSARPGDVKRHLADISRAKNLLSFNPQVNLDNGLNSTIAWYMNLFNQ